MILRPDQSRFPPSQTVQHYYSLASPWAYLGAQRLKDLARVLGVRVDSVPISTFKDNGWVPLMEKPAVRQAYVFADLRRWAKRIGVPLVLDQRPPGMAGLADALPMVWAAQVTGHDALDLSIVLQRAYWEQCEDVGTATVRAQVATDAGYDGAGLVAMEDSAEVAAQRDAMFAAARAAGVFGSPTYVFNGEMFWGQDRLDFLAEAMSVESVA